MKNEQKDTTKVSLEKFRSFSFLSFFPSLLFLFVYFFKAVWQSASKAMLILKAKNEIKPRSKILLREVLFDVKYSC